MEFKPMPKMARLSREVIITEKIDGTNASVFIEPYIGQEAMVVTQDGQWAMHAGSRKRWLGVHDDNFGWANWVTTNADELVKLGPGHHFGEWWGKGIQRGYGLAERRFSLFNVGRWKTCCSDAEGLEPAPGCCGVVPTLYRGLMTDEVVNAAIGNLQQYGSKAAPGFMDPEGIVVYHTAANQLFKKTIKGDELGKSREGQITAAPKVRTPRDPNVGGRRICQEPISIPDRRRPK